jgi:hypothetical protein
VTDSPFPPPPTREVVTGDRIATDLLRAAVDRDRTVVTRHGLAVCLRAALFADLALAGALGDTGRAPQVTGEAPDDRILAAVHRTVASRPKVAWKRWYRHVDVDLTALTDELVGAGRWTELGARLGRREVLDRDADGALAVGLRARAVGLGEEQPESPREAVLGVLAVSCGGGHGAARPKAAVPLHDLLGRFDDVGGQRLQAAHVAVGTAQLLVRKRRRRLS